MPTRLNPYLGFRDNAREAMEFYKTVFGGDLTLSEFGDMMASEDPREATKIMHGELVTGDGLTVMAADTPNSMPFNPGDNYSVSLSGEDAAELTGYWDKFSNAGTVLQPLVEAPWGDSFGMCRDQFGVTWLINIAGSKGAAG
ncbi:MAG: 3-demethylubiquinone-9 3-methyltransferase [Glaciihabitans sp.]|nr:3-demethylubiquinone-9 3-methyltransferase [Glaciihabitans sp.]